MPLIIKVEIKPYRWQDKRGESCKADFFPFVDGEPRHDITCENCARFRGNEPCDPALYADDKKSYPFCGSICGYFATKGDA